MKFSTSLTTKSLGNSNILRFISINAPYSILNSLPFDMRIYLNVEEEEDGLEMPILKQNPNLTDLLGSSIQVRIFEY